MMRTLKCGAWGERVVFHTRSMSYGLFKEADDLARQIKEQCPEEGEALNLGNLTLMIVGTPKIEFNLTENDNPPLWELHDFWTAYETAGREERINLALHWFQYTTKDVIVTWMEALNQATESVRRPEQLSTDMLTEEERVQLEDPNSPLASPAETSERVS